MRSMTVYNFLLESALWGSVLISAVLIVRAALRRGIGSKAVYLAWLLVAARLLLPIALPNPHMNALRPTLSTDTAARPIADQIRTRFIDALDGITDALYPDDSADASIIRKFAKDTDRGRTGNAALMLYACGSIITAIIILCRNAHYRRRMWRNRVGALEGEAADMYGELCERLNVKPVPIFYIDRIADARLIGVFKPFIAIPLDTPPCRLRLLLTQQLCHLRAKDGIWSLVRCICLTLHWMNIFAWLAAWYSRIDCELACDEHVTALLDEPLQYSNELALHPSRLKWSILLVSTGVSLNSAQHRRRVSAAIRPKRTKRWKRVLCAIFGIIAAIAAF